MGMDIRTPIGLMFTVLGVILLAVGLFGSSDIYEKSLGTNMNLWWGIVLLVFGGGMLYFGTRRKTATTVEVDHARH